MAQADWRDSLKSLLPDDYAPQEEEAAPQKPKAAKGLLHVSIDRKRAGRVATIISGFNEDDEEIAQVAALLKKKLAVGGSARGGEILVQGERAEAAAKILTQQGYKVKRI